MSLRIGPGRHARPNVVCGPLALSGRRNSLRLILADQVPGDFFTCFEYGPGGPVRDRCHLGVHSYTGIQEATEIIQRPAAGSRPISGSIPGALMSILPVVSINESRAIGNPG